MGQHKNDSECKHARISSISLGSECNPMGQQTDEENVCTGSKEKWLKSVDSFEIMNLQNGIED